MAKITKTKSGSWTVLVYDYTDERGKKHYKRITEPTKSECSYSAKVFELNRKNRVRTEKTVGDAVKEYIDSRRATRSPSTICGYEQDARNRFKELQSVPLRELTEDIVQKAIDDETQKTRQKGGNVISPKTVCNAWGLISAALKKYKLSFDVSLPQVIIRHNELPNVAEILPVIKGTSIELPCLLSMWLSLTISEVRGIDCSAIRNGILHIEKARIQMEGVNIEKQTMKNDNRARIVAIPPYIMELINNTDTYRKFVETGENCPLISLNANQIYSRWKRLCKNNNLPEITYHDLRHVFASVGLKIGVPNKYLQEIGGWKTDYILSSVYQQTFSQDRLEANAKIDSYYESLLDR